MIHVQIAQDPNVLLTIHLWKNKVAFVPIYKTYLTNLRISLVTSNYNITWIMEIW